MSAEVVSDAPVVAVVGPTATGKSDLGIAIAQRLGTAEIVNADSMQLYRGMDIGTAKVPPAERGGVPHHLLDVWPVTRSAAAHEYQVLARAAIAEIHARGNVPVIVGGSGLYLRGVLDRVEFPGESPEVRTRLEGELEAVGPGELHRRLTGIDPEAAAGILPSNGRRIVRALEVVEVTGRPFRAVLPGFDSVYPRLVKVGIDRADLDARVDRRVEAMMAAGFLDEVRGLLPELRGSPTAGKAIGYAQLLAVLADDGTVTGDLDEAVDATQRRTRRFVKRQRSWWRRDPRIVWLDGADPELLERAVDTLALWG
ncbi:tRNA (adenosine(37)-N6)-dimethylallyltransferase MiaA [Jatrophihabitans sp. YIM 134969]